MNSKYCPSCALDPANLSPSSPLSPEHRVKRSRAGRNSKLPIAALNRLQSWLDANKHNPYPTADTKRILAQQCGITEKQVNTWFTNARARQMSAHQADVSSEVECADDSEDADFSESNTGIISYAQEGAFPGKSHRRASIASPSQPRPSRRGKKKDYRRNHNADAPQTPLLLSPASITSPVEPVEPADQEMWQCTFCLKSLVPKSWRRHEDTQHRPKTQAARWTCMLHGPRLTVPNRTNTGSVCAFCMLKNPTEEHFQQHHRIEECSRRDVTDRTFYRPDHLRQHIKNFHNATLFDIVQARWKKAAEIVAEGWTCGFCGDRLVTWDKREAHIANHFKEGLTMASWQEHPDMDRKADKKKSKRKEKETGTVLGGIRIGNPFRRPTSSHQLQPQAQHDHFANSFQQLPITPQIPAPTHGYQTVPSPCPSTGFQSAYTSPTAPLGLGITQAPVLPAIPNMSPLMVTPHDFDPNYIDWTTLPTSFDPQMQYSLAHAGSYGTPMPATSMSLQPDYTNALGLGLYGHPVEYQRGWDTQTQQQHQHQHQRQRHEDREPYVPQHYQTREQ
jgi:hypothetical protein